MANLSTGKEIYLCHFCAKEYSTRAKLLTHFSQCQCKIPTNQSKETIPRLNRIQLEILLMVKLHPIQKSHSSSNSSSHHPSIDNLNLQIPLANLYSHGYLFTSNQSSFDDSDCNLNHSEENLSNLDNTDESLNSNHNHKLSSYHIYKYSRRERAFYYSGIKKRLLSSTTTRKSRSNERIPPIFHQNNYHIQIPTKINARQRISSNCREISPLLFSPNFHSLVKLSHHPLLENYFVHIQIYFHLLHSIASQEFQIIVHNYDHSPDYSYTSVSFLNLLQQTMLDFNKNFQRVYKREHSDDEHQVNNELVIPPLKIRRHDGSSYEIDKRSTSSSSSGMSITQIHNGQSYEDRRRCFDTRPKKFPSRISDIQMNSNSNDIPDSMNGSPTPNDLSTNDHQQWKDRTSMREQANDSLPKYQSVALNEGARIRIVNCSNDSNKHSSNPSKKPSNSLDKLDENWSSKSTRLHTRKISSTNSKTSDSADISPSYQAQSVLLSHEEIAHGWSTHNVFYRCHACSHEEFFVVLSRECMRLHVSSKHGNMEENFKQRLSNFLNNQGRALKIFQHYLKWQQPWSENEIDQIFQLANINQQTNGAL